MCVAEQADLLEKVPRRLHPVRLGAILEARDVLVQHRVPGAAAGSDFLGFPGMFHEISRNSL